MDNEGLKFVNGTILSPADQDLTEEEAKDAGDVYNDEVTENILLHLL
jgi:hypothetical protein